MKKTGKRIWAPVLACWMVVSAVVPAYAAQSGEETVQPMLEEPVRTKLYCTASSSCVLTVKNEYTALDDAVTRVVITTYVEKRKLLVAWERVDIGQENNKWIDVIYGDGGSSLLDTVTKTNKVTC